MRFGPRPGTFTIALGSWGVLVGLLGDSLASVIAFVVSGIAIDLSRAWGFTRRGTAPIAITGGLSAALLTALTFVAGSPETGFTWDGELAVGVTVMAGLVAAACAALAGPTVPAAEAGGLTTAGPPA